MNRTKQIQLTCIMLLSVMFAQAQTTVTASGGEALGSGGTVSYTVGQVTYQTHRGTNTSVAEGVQQPYEISVVTGIEEAKDIKLLVSAYPNPATDYLTVKVENYETANLQYLVFNINGELLQKVKCAGNETNINIQDYSTATYFVKVIDRQKEIKTFKIIKN